MTLSRQQARPSLLQPAMAHCRRHPDGSPGAQTDDRGFGSCRLPLPARLCFQPHLES